MIKFILENFDTIFKNENSLETLNKIILDLAIRGKLVPQNENDEPAEELLKRIQAEKERLIKEKVIKKEKTLPEITEEEIPFDIPKNWEWVRLGNIIKYTENLDIQKKLKEDTLINYVDIDAIDNKNYKILETKKRTVKQLSSRARRILKKDYIMYSSVRPYLNNLCIIEEEKENFIGSTGFFVFKPFIIEKKYIFLLLLCDYVIQYFTYSIKGFNSPSINNNIFEKTLIPLPPLEEQKRIVEKVEKLQELIKNLKEIYSSDEKNRNSFKKSLLTEIEKSSDDTKLLNNLELVFNNFDKIVKTKEDIKDIRNLILSLAIKGKLVPQNENDEPAGELLKRIQTEKERLIKEKVIKKEKSLPEITEDEIPFDIPKNWKVVRMNDIGNYRKGPFGSALTKNIFVPKGKDTVKVYEQKNAIQKNHTLGEYYITKEYFENKMKGFEVNPHDIIVSCAGTIGETYVLPENIEKGIINQALMRMRISSEININFFLLYFDYVLKKYSNDYSKGSAIKNIPPFEIFKNFIFLLPPLEEQKRIVEKVENLMEICNLLEEKINISENISENLLKSFMNNRE